MTTLSETIKHYRKLNGLTQTELAKILDVQPTAVSAWELGRNKPLMDKVELMSDTFKISKSELLGEELFSENNISHIYFKLTSPRQDNVYRYAEHQLNQQRLEEDTDMYVVGQTATSEPITGQQVVPLIEAENLNLVVNGDSMEPQFFDGDIIKYHPQSQLENGEIGVFTVNGGITMKKFRTNGSIRLESLNEKYEDIVITEDIDFSILGKVVK